MKLNKCYINNFGKLSDFSYEFDSEINVINEENGFGKSTLCAFLKAMFYGLPSSRSKSLDENERKKYTPWQGGVFGGSLEFSCEKGTYRIERTFGNKQSLDTFSLYSLESGKESNDFSENIGEELFGIDLKGFERCCFIGTDVSSDKMPVSVSSRILGTEDKDGLGNFDNAMDSLLKRSRQYKTTGERGIIPDKEREIAEAQNGIDEADNSRDEIDEINRRKINLEGRKFVILKELENTRALISDNASIEVIKQKIKHYNSLVSSAKSAQSNYEAIEQKFGGKLPEEREIETLSHLLEKREELKNGENNGEADYLRKRRIVFSVVSGVLTIVAALSFVLALGQSALFAFIGVLSIIIDAVIGVFLRFDNKRKKKEYTSLVTANEENIYSLINQLGIKEFGRDFSEILAELKADLNKYNIEKAKFDEYYNDAKKYYKDENLESVKEDIASKTPDELKLKEQSLTRDFDIVSAEVLKYESKIEKLSEKAETYSDLLFKKQVAQKQLQTATENYDALIKGIELLKNAKESLIEKYKQKIEQSFKDYLFALTDGKITDVMLSDDFEITVCDSGFSREISSYSSGTKAVIEIALRLSMLDALFVSEKSFIIFDDSFVHLDDKSFMNVAEKVKKLSKNIQILYFTCTNSRAF